MSQTTMNSIDQQKQLQRKEAKQRRALAYQGQTNAGLKACDIWCSQVDLPPNQIISIYVQYLPEFI